MNIKIILPENFITKKKIKVWLLFILHYSNYILFCPKMCFFFKLCNISFWTTNIWFLMVNGVTNFLFEQFNVQKLQKRFEEHLNIRMILPSFKVTQKIMIKITLSCFYYFINKYVYIIYKTRGMFYCSLSVTYYWYVLVVVHTQLI